MLLLGGDNPIAASPSRRAPSRRWVSPIRPTGVGRVPVVEATDQPPGTLERVVSLDSPLGARTIWSRRLLYASTSTVLAGIVLLALVEALGIAPIYGVSSARVHASGGGYDLDVRYAEVSRPALATPFEIAVERPGGFDQPVTVAVRRDYLAMWDENGFYPSPSSETTSGAWLVWEFDPPDGEVLSFAYDGRIEPSAQWGRDGAVAVLEGGVPVVQVDFTTRVRP